MRDPARQSRSFEPEGQGPSRALSVGLIGLALAVLLGASLARADDDPRSWEEPTLEEALKRTKLVVRAHVLGAAGEENGAPRVVADRAVLGTVKPGESITLGGTRSAVPLDEVLPPLKAGDDVLLLLEESSSPVPDKPRWKVPSPSFGAFVVEDGKVRASLRDSFVRVPIKVADYETFLKNASAVTSGGKADAAWLESARTTLRRLEPTASTSFAEAHVALETLCYGALEQDSELALRYFSSSQMQLRISAARLLSRVGGERASAGLLRLALNDSEPAVRSIATLALPVVKPAPENAVKELVSHAAEASAKPVSLALGPSDPRHADLASVLGATLEALRALGAQNEATTAAIALLAKDDDATIAEACLFLTRVRPTLRLHEIARRLRDAEHPNGTTFNKPIADVLRKITGMPIGTERERWLYYLQENSSVYPDSGDR